MTWLKVDLEEYTDAPTLKGILKAITLIKGVRLVMDRTNHTITKTSVLNEQVAKIAEMEETEEVLLLPEWLIKDGVCQAVKCLQKCPAYDFGCRLSANSVGTNRHVELDIQICNLKAEIATLKIKRSASAWDSKLLGATKKARRHMMMRMGGIHEECNEALRMKQTSPTFLMIGDFPPDPKYVIGAMLAIRYFSKIYKEADAIWKIETGLGTIHED
jgi:hypothetical protein